MLSPASPNAGSVPVSLRCADQTRASLVGNLHNLGDRRRWQQFFDTYSKLIYSVARKSGLTDAESQDTVQETAIAVARNIGKYDADAGSFKGWLLQMTRWRITDQFRKRMPAAAVSPMGEPDSRNGVESIPDPQPANLDAVWEEEWRDHLLGAALERVKQRVNAHHYQIFECAVRKGWTPAKVAKELGINIAQVYLIRHRITGVLRKALREVEGGL